MADIKWSAFPAIGALATGDVLVGLRAGANVKFNALTIPWTVANGGTGRATSTTAYALLAAGTTATGAQQSLGTGTAGQLLQSGGASALPTWTTPTFPSGSGTLNHMLRSDGTNWVQTTATTLDSSDVLSGLTQLNVDNLRLDGNTLSTTNSNGNFIVLPNGTGNTLIGSSTAMAADFTAQVVGIVGSSGHLAIGSYNNVLNFANLDGMKSASATVGSFSAITSSEPISALNAWGDDGTQFTRAGSIRCTASGTISNGVVPGMWQFFTANTSGVLTNAMTISNAQIVSLTNPLGASSGGTGIANAAGSTITLGGALTTSGAFASTFTMTGVTSVTFPTSGTLATTAGTVTTATNLAGGTANDIPYQTGVGTTGFITETANGVLVYSAGGVPSSSTTLPSGLAATNMNLTTPTLGVASATSLTFSSTSGIIGTTTNNDAAALSVGQYVSSVISDGAPVSVSTGTATEVTSISLTAGDWDVWGNIQVNGGASTNVTLIIGAINTAVSLPGSQLYAANVYGAAGIVPFTTNNIGFCVPGRRVTLSGTTTIYLITYANFSVSTLTTCGAIYARRRR